MNKLPKKALSLVTTCAMTLSLANPVLMVAAEEVTNKNESSVVQAAATEQSKCNLASLSVKNQTLSPEFSADILDYTIADLPYTTSSITVNATAETEGSTVKITYTNYKGEEKTASSSGLVSNLKYGKNVINVAVTSEDGSETKVYTITANKKSALSSITATVDGKDLVLTPSFKSSVNDYEATIAKGSKSVLIKATASITSDYNTIKVNGQVLSEDGVSIDLNGETNNITITITGDDQKGENTYNLTIKEVDSASLNVNCDVEDVVV
ncbi:MAG: cadherin-like beta sandwich domain-containing protein, partial [Intestinibacter sp.]|uniref:cadherin-like beta sandwich domain-containing protein n=1 Tax=Intestinibacter sp. TaxID=1965304 RepID=UPI003F184F8E